MDVQRPKVIQCLSMELRLRTRPRPKRRSNTFTSTLLTASSSHVMMMMVMMMVTMTMSPTSSADAFAFTASPTSQTLIAKHQCRKSTSTTCTTSTSLYSDVPRDRDAEKSSSPSSSSSSSSSNIISSLLQDIIQSSRMRMMPPPPPPPPEDQFIMTGDISVLFLYAFTSHYLNNMLVHSVLENANSIQDAIHTLDPNGDVALLQTSPVWVAPDQTQVLQNVLTIQAQDSLLDHYGGGGGGGGGAPLLSTAGSACVALCSCWLLAGWFHRAFLFQNSLDCETDRALWKTLETWMTTMILMILLAFGSHELVGLLGLFQNNQQEYHAAAAAVTADVFFLTKADTMFLVDSASVLIVWRYMANSMMKMFR